MRARGEPCESVLKTIVESEDTLGTPEQLGYQVSMTFRNTFGVFGLSVTVNTQANKFTADHVDQRVENFFKTFVF